jgi:hypothetical protein
LILAADQTADACEDLARKAATRVLKVRIKI